MLTVQINWSYPINYIKLREGQRAPSEKKPLFVHLILDQNIKREAEDRFVINLKLILDKLKQGINLSEIEIKLKETYLIEETDTEGKL